MNKALHFAWWLTVPHSSEQLVQLCALGATDVVKIEARAGGRKFAPTFNRQLNGRMPPVFWWKNGRDVYDATVTFKDGSEFKVPTLDMRAGHWQLLADGSAPSVPSEHRQHSVYSNSRLIAPLNAKMGWGGAAELDLWVNGCAFDGHGLDKIDNWFPGWRRVFVTDCVFQNCMNGPQGSNVELVRGCQLDRIGQDALSDALIVWDATISNHIKGRADLHPDSYQFRKNGPAARPKLIAGIRDFSIGSQGIFADASTFVRNVAIVRCDIGTDGVGAALSLEHGVENLLIDSCNFTGPRRITSNRTNVVIRNTPGVS